MAEIQETLEQYARQGEQILAARSAKIMKRTRLYEGKRALGYTTAQYRLPEYSAMSVNVYRQAVNAVANRIKVKKIAVTSNNAAFNRSWNHANGQQILPRIITETLCSGVAYARLHDQGGEPVIIPEKGTSVCLITDPDGNTLAAVRHIKTAGKASFIVTTTTHVAEITDGKLTEIQENILGFIPIVEFRNHSLINGGIAYNGVEADTTYSVVDDLEPLVEAASKTLADMLVAGEETARPKRWATGIALEEPDEWEVDTEKNVASPAKTDGAAVASPFDSQTWVSENDTARFGQLSGANLEGFVSMYNALSQAIMCVSGLPAHMLGITTVANPTSADALRAAESGLIERAENRREVLAPAVEELVKKFFALLTGSTLDNEVTVTYAPCEFATLAQQADAVTKLIQVGVLRRDQAAAYISEHLGVTLEPPAETGGRIVV